MKTKMILLVVITAIATLSFTYVATHNEKAGSTATAETSQSEVVGGLVSEEN